MPVFTIETPTGTKLDIEADNEQAALAGAQQWHSTNKPDAVPDIVKSAAVAPAKVALGMAGAIPAISEAAHGAANKYLFDPLFNAISGPPKSSPAPYDLSADVGSKLGNVSQSLYQPKTPQGGYSGSIAEGVTGAMMGPGGTLMKIIQGVGAGAGSEAAGSYFKDSALEPYMRFLGGVTGGIGAGLGSKGVESLKNINAAQNTGADIASVIGGPQLKAGAVSRVAKNISDEELTAPQVAARTQELGPNAMVMDLGHQLENRADFMAQHSGQAQNTVYKPIAERAEGIAPQLNAVLDKHMGPSQNVVTLQNGIEDWSRKNVGPLYQALEKKYPVVNDARLQELSQRPAIASAMGSAENIAKDMGEKVSGAQPSIAYWDFVKKSLDQRISRMMKGSDESSAAQSTMQAVMKARNDLVQHLDNVTGGEYAQARKLATTKPAMEEALDLGRSVFDGKMLPEQLADQLNGISLAERKMVEIGVRREIERRVGMPGDEGRKLRSLLAAPNNSAKLEAIVGSQANQEIQNQVAAADQFQRLKNKIEGTRTATRTAGMNDTSAPTFNQNPTVLGAAAALPRMGINYALEHGMANTRQDISRILTAKGSQVKPVAQMLMNYNAKRAENAVTPLGQQAAALIRALVSGGIAK